MKTWKPARIWILGLLGAALLLGCSDSSEDGNGNASEDGGGDDDAGSPTLSVVPIDLSTVTRTIAFGEMLETGYRTPAFEYFCNTSAAQVRSCCGGTVVRLQPNSNSDYEIGIQATPEWEVIYDHVLNVTVSVGDSVSAGTSLGTVGTDEHFELQINRTRDGATLAYCPFSCATSGFISQHQALAATWCLMDTVSP